MNGPLPPANRKIILASASPRRRELLAAAGIACEVRPASIEEKRNPDEKAADYVLRLACEKAAAVPASADEIVLGADTTVVVDEAVLEKPLDAADARRMLSLLSNRAHVVMTGVCIRHGSNIIHWVEHTTVTFGPITSDEIDAYVASGEPMDKAGAYAIQGAASRWIGRIEGCYFNVVGLPLASVWRNLKTALND